jgi:hypothetical protein
MKDFAVTIYYFIDDLLKKRQNILIDIRKN